MTNLLLTGQRRHVANLDLMRQILAPLVRSPSVADDVEMVKTIDRWIAGRDISLNEAQQARALAAMFPEHASTPVRFAWLAAVCGVDVVVGKLFESHLDALSILAELAPDTAGPYAASDLWAVWAAEGPGMVRADPDADGAWTVSGCKSWCSGAADVDRALITARQPDGVSRMFAISLHDPGVQVTDEGWDAIGMRRTRSVDVHLHSVAAQPVGVAGDYVARPGFWQGAAGIAACWFGAAVAIGERCHRRAAALGDRADAHLLVHLGAIDVRLHAARLVLSEAARAIDHCRAGSGCETMHFDARQALRVRALIESAATEVIERCGRALGAGPLCREADHARRVADLAVFMRQSHAERDLEAVGRQLAGLPSSHWALQP